VTHPFHPLFGRSFRLVAYRNNWGENRVFFVDDSAQSSWMPASWTDLEPLDPFVVQAAGRAAFRVQDLLELARRMGVVAPKGKPRRRRRM